MNLENKNVLVTGAGVRLGRAISLELAKNGAHIAIHCNRSKSDAKSLKKEIQNLGRNAEIFPLNLNDFQVRAEKVAKEFSRAVLKSFGHIDVLVNNAAIYYPTPFEKMTEKEWDDFMAVNLKAPIFLSQVFGVLFKKRRKGKIINIADIAAENPFDSHLPYSISKAGMVAATQSLAKELAPHVQVNAVSPGPILEPPQGLTAANKKKLIQKTLLKRMGCKEDIAQAVRFLAESDYITGEIIRVDGGKSLCTA